MDPKSIPSAPQQPPQAQAARVGAEDGQRRVGAQVRGGEGVVQDLEGVPFHAQVLEHSLEHEGAGAQMSCGTLGWLFGSLLLRVGFDREGEVVCRQKCTKRAASRRAVGQRDANVFGGN